MTRLTCVGVRINDDDLDELKQMAADKGCTVSGLLRSMIEVRLGVVRKNREICRGKEANGQGRNARDQQDSEVCQRVSRTGSVIRAQA
jgi:hypothetical protein